MPAPAEITPAQLSRLIGTPDAPIVLDTRIDDDVANDPRAIPTSRRTPFGAVSDLAAELTGQHVVVACQKGRKLSQGAAALLRADGVRAEALVGGTLGWAEDGQPTIPMTALPVRGTAWVTRQRPKIDRIACPWLVRRFVDPQAKVLFVPPADVLLVAEKFNAIAFDVEGAELTHQGDGCTFDALLDRFDLRTAPLDRLATVIRAADTDRHDLSPQAAGLLAVSVGLSRQFKDDLKQLDAGMALYDALYRWARDGYEEGHTWPTPGGRAP